MKEKSSTEIVADLFIMPAFRTARHQHPEIEDEEELLPCVLELLRLATRQFDRTMEVRKNESDAIYDVMVMFRMLCPTSVQGLLQ